jgi:hypothetical protein
MTGGKGRKGIRDEALKVDPLKEACMTAGNYLFLYLTVISIPTLSPFLLTE